MSKAAKKPMLKAKNQPSTANVKKRKALTKKKPATKRKGKATHKKFDDSSDDSSFSSSDSELGEAEDKDEIDMAALMEQAMAGAKNSILHSLCWWRIVLGKAAIKRFNLLRSAVSMALIRLLCIMIKMRLILSNQDLRKLQMQHSV